MKKINLTALILSFLVITSFSAVGIAIAFRSIIAIIVFMFLGFSIMGYGISLKKKNNA